MIDGGDCFVMGEQQYSIPSRRRDFALIQSNNKIESQLFCVNIVDKDVYDDR